MVKLIVNSDEEPHNLFQCADAPFEVCVAEIALGINRIYFSLLRSGHNRDAEYLKSALKRYFTDPNSPVFTDDKGLDSVSVLDARLLHKLKRYMEEQEND